MTEAIALKAWKTLKLIWQSLNIRGAPMQNTRLSTIISTRVVQLSRWSRNPWRRISLNLIGLLGGFFTASFISTTAGVKSELDTVAAGITLLVVEVINRLAYSPRRPVLDDGSKVPRLLTIEILNSVKIGIVYGLFLEAFKLGS